MNCFAVQPLKKYYHIFLSIFFFHFTSSHYSYCDDGGVVVFVKFQKGNVLEILSELLLTWFASLNKKGKLFVRLETLIFMMLFIQEITGCLSLFFDRCIKPFKKMTTPKSKERNKEWVEAWTI